MEVVGQRVVKHTAPAAATRTPALPSRAATVTPPLLSPAAVATAPAAAAAAVRSQTAHAPPSPTGGDAAHGSGNVQCAV
ncbi:unnamed protein product [Closterium sp. NIES-64]|nr:unnamed protein product [Closterium sp. NIES-64]